MSTTVSTPAPPVAAAAGLPAGPAARRLTPAQLATLSPVLRSALAGIAVQLHHCTPFSALKYQLRADAAAIRGVLHGPGTCTEAQLATIAAVVSARLSALRAQLRRCENPRFRRTLRAEEAKLQAVQNSFG